MIETERLLLRPWRDADREPFAALNADPDVRRYFPSTLSRAESDAGVDRQMAHFAAHGFGLWALERRADGAFLGFTGLRILEPEDPPFPGIEIGWRLARHAWGCGHASEAARASLAYGFETLGLAEIVAFTAQTNLLSERVMQRIGMTHDPARDFDHPAVPEGHPLRPHILYFARSRALTTA